VKRRTSLFQQDDLAVRVGGLLDSLRVRLIARVLDLPEERLLEPEQFLNRTPAAPAALADEKYWPHAPQHHLSDHGTYIVTASTNQKEHHFRGPARLHYVHQNAVKHGLVQQANQYRWCSAAWWGSIPGGGDTCTCYLFIELSRPSSGDLGWN
jgi:hypothetical protein